MNWEILYKTITTAVGAIVGYIFGEWSVLLQILLAFVIIDYVSGLLASGVEGKLSSKVGFKGIAKKLMIFVLVAVGHLVDKAIGDGSMIQNAIIFFYLGNELLSILENAGRTGLPVPEQVKNAVEILKGKSK
ncbi:phage holin family protein [Caldifermentibacillus hisashii]|uniref:phage holin family protein n=1 Tax=Caldifermentibacillus hisashii TaxID=996558 RepID=UPI0031B67C22